MYSFFRTTLITFLWFSLLSIVWAFFSYVCYAGLCGGPVASYIQNHHSFLITYTGLYVWAYPLVVFASLYYSRKFSENKNASLSLLFIPLACITPLFYLHNIEHTQAKIADEKERQYYSIQKDDYACNQQLWFRVNEINPINVGLFSASDNSSSTIAFAYNIDEIKRLLKEHHLNPNECKNHDGATLSELIKSIENE